MKLVMFLLIIIVSLWSAPALTIKREFKQPDGTTFSARMQGDEFLHWVEAEDGSILLFNKKEKRFEHAILQAKRLSPSGEVYTPAATKQSVPLHPRVSREQLQQLWKERRAGSGLLRHR